MLTPPDNDIWRPSQRLWRPKPRVRTQGWCDENLRLDPKIAYFGGQWQTERFPHLRGVMWVWDRRKTEEIDLQWATRLGKTTLIRALMGHAAKNDPAPAMVVAPNMTSIKKFERKSYAMYEYCKPIERLLPPDHKRAFPIIDLRHMFCYLAWSGSPTLLGEESIRYMFMTELDKWSSDASHEADPEPLAQERTKDWPNKKIFKESTPTVEGLSRIAKNLAAADVILEYFVPCPHCDEYQLLDYGGEGEDTPGIKYAKPGGKSEPAVARETAYYQCAHCNGRIEDDHRRNMLAQGVWAPRGHKVPRGTKALVLFGGHRSRKVGMRLSSLYSPTLTWGEMAETFLLYCRDPRKLQDWENSWMARTFSIVPDRPHWAKVKERLSTTTERGKVPEWSLGLTAGIDVGKYRNHYIIRAWGRGGKSQLVEAGVVAIGEGVTQKQGVASAIDAVLSRSFGGQEVRLVLVDSGFATSDVYAACRAMGPRCLPLKGEGGIGAKPPWRASVIEVDPRTGRRFEHGQKVIVVDADYWKGYVFGKLAVDPADPAAWLLHKDIEEEYVRCICNVVPVPELDTRGRQKIVWRVLEEEWDEHYNDAECYCAAAADMLRLRQIPESEPPPRAPRKAEPSRFRMNRRNIKIRRR